MYFTLIIIEGVTNVSHVNKKLKVLQREEREGLKVLECSRMEEKKRKRVKRRKKVLECKFDKSNK